VILAFLQLARELAITWFQPTGESFYSVWGQIEISVSAKYRVLKRTEVSISRMDKYWGLINMGFHFGI
jgi:hypothetical protein